MRLLLALMFGLCHISALAQTNEGDFVQSPIGKRFIDKVDVFVGPNLSFNYGNKFIENYDEPPVHNTRKLKVGYSFGLALYHPVNNWLDINLRLAYEEKGTNSEMNLPDIQRNTKYTYKYLTVSLAPVMYLGKSKEFSFSLGGYYGKMRSAKGDIIVLDTKDNVTFVEKFYGREVNEINADGSITSGTYAPGLQAYEDDDLGITVGLGYLIRLNQKTNVRIQLIDSFGLININKPVLAVYNPPEKNHTISLLIGYVLRRSNKK